MPVTYKKSKVQRRFGEVLVPRRKYQKIIEKRPYPAGEHGTAQQFVRGKRRSDFAMQLDEKQKLRFVYNVLERQMRNYFTKATTMPGQTGHNLLVLLERRLDNLVYRAGLAPTIWAARQLVVHGHILVNGRRVDRPSYSVEAGDVITLHEKMRRNAHIKEWVDEAAPPPNYLDVDLSDFRIELKYIPERKEIPVYINEQLVVEFYNRRT
ncbi:MAG: 30S ribosomal protein S4 [Phototrophicales bacterium]|nr:MAG: 30S ribosomal protein S4 [Phototrophicales bacterium]